MGSLLCSLTYSRPTDAGTPNFQLIHIRSYLCLELSVLFFVAFFFFLLYPSSVVLVCFCLPDEDILLSKLLVVSRIFVRRRLLVSSLRFLRPFSFLTLTCSHSLVSWFFSYSNRCYFMQKKLCSQLKRAPSTIPNSFRNQLDEIPKFVELF